jgi:hypothetical protein
MDDETSKKLREALERDLRQMFELTLHERLDRAVALDHHRILAAHHFAEASAECIELWRDGRFYAVVMMSQAIAEGICRLVLDRRGLSEEQYQGARIRRLAEAGLISDACASALRRIATRELRNDIHHMNPTIAASAGTMRELAAQHVRDLSTVEAEIFAFDVEGGKLRPKTPAYWDVEADGSAHVYLRCI